MLSVSALERKTGFHLDIEDYLNGLLQLCSELVSIFLEYTKDHEE